jgi:protease-4
VVVEGRNMDEADVRRLADGSVYTGRQALELGLVDALGYEDDALAKAGELGGIQGTPRVIRYTHEPSLYELFGAATSARPMLPSPQEVSNWLGWPSLLFQAR